MKQGKKPTRKQKIAIKAGGYNPDNWLVYKQDNEYYYIVHRYTNTKKRVFK